MTNIDLRWANSRATSYGALEFGFYSMCDFIPIFGIYSTEMIKLNNDIIFLYSLSASQPYKKATKVTGEDNLTFYTKGVQTIYNKDGSFCFLSKGCMAHFENDKLVFDFVLAVKKEALFRKTNKFDVHKVNPKDLTLFVNKDSKDFIKATKLVNTLYLEKLYANPDLDIVMTNDMEKHFFRKPPLVLENLPKNQQEEMQLFTDLQTHVM